MKALRKLLSIVLLALFCLPVAAPLLAQTAESRLPACCRRAGAHHCSQGMEPMPMGKQQGADQHHWQMAMSCCRQFPASLAMAPHVDAYVAATVHTVFVGAVSDVARAAQAECLRRIARDRSRQKRGPPASFLA